MQFLTRSRFMKISHMLSIVASIALVVSLSLEALYGDPFMKQTIYFKMQYWICVYFTIDFFLLWWLAADRRRFFLKYFFILLIAFPYLSVFDYFSIYLSKEAEYVIKYIPLMRGGFALVVLTLLVVKKDATALLISYVILLLSNVYFMSLLFYVFEGKINKEVLHYSDAAWWSAMTVTTLGSVIQPITVMGKVVTTILAATGMMIFPIFTVYVTSMVMRVSKKEAVSSLDSVTASTATSQPQAAVMADQSGV